MAESPYKVFCSDTYEGAPCSRSARSLLNSQNIIGKKWQQIQDRSLIRFGVPDSKSQNKLSEDIAKRSPDEDPTNTTESNIKFDGKTYGRRSLSSRSELCMVIGYFLILGTIGVLLWNILSTEKRIKELENNFEMIKQVLEATSESCASKSREEPITSIATLSLSQIRTTGAQMTISDEAISNSTATAATTSTASTSAFQKLKSIEVMYLNRSFLAMQLNIPYDGLSKSENWCREYQLLCQQQGRSPTGCGINYANMERHQNCSIVYGSNRVAGNVLGCYPWTNIQKAMDIAFPGVVPKPMPEHNVLGFNECEPSSCQRHIRDSKLSLYSKRLNAFWEDGERIVYTVCY